MPKRTTADQHKAGRVHKKKQHQRRVAKKRLNRRSKTPGTKQSAISWFGLA